MKFELISPEEVERIHRASVIILEKTGVRFLGKKALDAFAAAGAAVDFDQKLVKIPENLLERMLQNTTNHFRLWNRSGEKLIDLQDGRVRGHNVGGCVRIFDLQKGQARDAAQSDLEQFTTLIDALENIHVCRPMVYPNDFPKNMWDIYTAATMLRFTEKPYGVTAYSLENLDYILQLTSVIAGSLENLIAKPFIWGSVCPDSPLSYSESTSDILVRYAEVGLPTAIAPCPISGASSPVTLAGTLVQLNAEFLAGLVLVQIIRPGLPVKYTARPIPMNMKTGMATFGAIEMGMMSAALVQLSKRYRVCSDSYGLGTRSKNLDEQAAYEKALNGILVALSGADLIAAAGLLQDALTSSADQLVIDNEILGMIFRAVRGIEVTDETLAVETIMKLGPGGNFLGDPHTRDHMRKEYIQPGLVYQSGIPLPQSPVHQTILDVARDTAERILKSHQPPQLPKEVLTEIQGIVDRATRNLIIAKPMNG
jgi:trimethylamine---corrinoid protein Co-methyltransferase